MVEEQGDGTLLTITGQVESGGLFKLAEGLAASRQKSSLPPTGGVIRHGVAPCAMDELVMTDRAFCDNRLDPIFCTW